MSNTVEKYDAMKHSAVNSMNYFFLRFATAHYETNTENILSEHLFDELQLFVDHLADFKGSFPEELKEMAYRELDEGAYLERISYVEFVDGVSKLLLKLTGEINESAFQFYADLATQKIAEYYEEES